jgi:hypothetical protein
VGVDLIAQTSSSEQRRRWWHDAHRWPWADGASSRSPTCGPDGDAVLLSEAALGVAGQEADLPADLLTGRTGWWMWMWSTDEFCSRCLTWRFHS